MKGSTKKGTFGYIKAMRKKTIVHTIVLFAIALLIFFAGKLRYPGYATMFSITAIVVCIPASMRCVSFIMFMIHKGGDEEFFRDCESMAEGICFYDSVITTSEKSYDVYAFAVSSDSVAGYCPEKDKDIAKLEKHLKDMFDKNGYADVVIKIFTSKEKFLTRLSGISKKTAGDPQKTSGIEGLLGNLSL